MKIQALVNIGGDLTKLVPGRVSTEVDARLAYDTHGIIRKVLISKFRSINLVLNCVKLEFGWLCWKFNYVFVVSYYFDKLCRLFWW